jgi:hypothetical protein
MKVINRLLLPAILVLATGAAGCCSGFHQDSVNDLNSVKSKQDALLDRYAAAPAADEQQQVSEIRALYKQTEAREKPTWPWCPGVPNAIRRSREAFDNDVKTREESAAQTPPELFSAGDIAAMKEQLDRFVDQAIQAVETRKH